VLVVQIRVRGAKTNSEQLPIVRCVCSSDACKIRPVGTPRPLKFVCQIMDYEVCQPCLGEVFVRWVWFCFVNGGAEKLDSECSCL